MVSTAETQIRRLRDADVEGAEETAHYALAEVGDRFGFRMGPRSAERIAFASSRIRHIAAHDPAGCVIAEHDGQVVGVGLAIKRGSLWFLSLLAVRQGLQCQGIGRRLLDATLDYGRDCTRGAICSSPDPKALRRYGQAGFALHPGYGANGKPDRTALPADLGVREGDWAKDADFVDELITQRRGEPYGPDLAWLSQQSGPQLLVREGHSPSDRAIAITHGGHLGVLAGANPDAATRVLWATLAEAPEEAELEHLLGNQQWAIRVVLDARLRLRLTDTFCTRGAMSPPDCYLPSGMFG